LKTSQSRVGDYYLTPNAQATYSLRANGNFGENNTDYVLSVENGNVTTSNINTVATTCQLKQGLQTYNESTNRTTIRIRQPLVHKNNRYNVR